MINVNGKLPTTVTININELDYDEEYDELDEVIGDYLSNTYEFCLYGFDFESVDSTGNINITNIDWDTSE